jgi:hypothetical protein
MMSSSRTTLRSRSRLGGFRRIGIDRFDALTAAAFAAGRGFATGRRVATGLAFGRGRTGLETLTTGRFCALLTGRFRAVGRFAARARGTGFLAFLADLTATRRFGAVRFRPVVFLDVARPRPAAFRPPLFFLPACPGRRRRARVAFRLAMGRPFAGLPTCAGLLGSLASRGLADQAFYPGHPGYSGHPATLTVSDKLRILYVLSATNNRSQSAFRGLLVTPRMSIAACSGAS